jgi:hypothetical protein
MINKRIGFWVMVVILAGAYFTGNAHAATDWHVCTVEAAGPGWNSVYIKLTAPAFPAGKWFTVTTTNGKEILAVALAAMSNGMQVMIYADASLNNPPIYTFYMLK